MLFNMLYMSIFYEVLWNLSKGCTKKLPALPKSNGWYVATRKLLSNDIRGAKELQVRIAQVFRQDVEN